MADGVTDAPFFVRVVGHRPHGDRPRQIRQFVAPSVQLLEKEAGPPRGGRARPRLIVEDIHSSHVPSQFLFARLQASTWVQVPRHDGLFHAGRCGPRPESDQGDSREEFRPFPRSPQFHQREDRPYIREERVLIEGGPMEGDEEHAEPLVHGQQDEVHVRPRFQLFRGVRPLSLRSSRVLELDRGEGRVHEVHERRDSDRRFRDKRELDGEPGQRVLHERSGRDQFRRYIPIVQVHAVPCESPFDQDGGIVVPFAGNRHLLPQSGTRDGESEGREEDSQAGHDSPFDAG